MSAHRKLQRRRQGLQIVGPGFYLWDQDAREALRRPVPLRHLRAQREPDA
jgi:hypothetical protein